MAERGRRGFQKNGNKKWAGNCHRPSGIEEDCIGNQGSKRTVVFEEEEKEEEEEEEKEKEKK
jgi:hypothetical protein